MLLPCLASLDIISVVALVSSALVFMSIVQLALLHLPVQLAQTPFSFQVLHAQLAHQIVRLAPVQLSVLSATLDTSSLRTPALPAPLSTPTGQAATTILLRPLPASLAPISAQESASGAVPFTPTALLAQEPEPVPHAQLPSSLTAALPAPPVWLIALSALTALSAQPAQLATTSTEALAPAV